MCVSGLPGRLPLWTAMTGIFVKNPLIPNAILQEAIAIGRTFASIKNYNIDGNKEMIAFGIMNMVGSCSSCYVATGKVLFIMEI